MFKQGTWGRIILRLWVAVSVVLLALVAVSVAAGSLLPTGGEVAYMSNQRGNPGTWDIFVLDVARGLSAPLTSDPLDERYPAYSPDGSQILYHANPNDIDYDLYVMNADGSAQRRLGLGDLGDYHEEAMGAWEPNGEAVIFHGGLRSGEFSLYIGDVASGDYYPVADVPLDAIHADWSPDGRHLVFTAREVFDSNNYERYTDLYVLEMAGDLFQPGGANLRRLTVGDTNQAYFPTWSPDGTQIAFVMSVPGYTDDHIYVMNADGTEMRNITASVNASNTHPEWLPDGRILFASNRADGLDFDLYIMEADGSNVQQLTNEPGDEQAPDWRP
ncbi:MAG: hypothetical protein OHK0046_22970 [Anaerolineae bacterium]